MQVCKSVKLRMRDRRNGTKSLFLDFWPGYRDPETMELIRRRSLGLYIYANPINAQQKQYNEIILSKAEAIRSLNEQESGLYLTFRGKGKLDIREIEFIVDKNK